MIPLELTLSKIHKELQRASRSAKGGACAKAQFLQRRKRGTQSTERLKWEEMSRSEKMDSVLRNYFAGWRIRKTETNVFEIRQGSGFRPAGGCGRNAGRVS